MTDAELIAWCENEAEYYRLRKDDDADIFTAIAARLSQVTKLQDENDTLLLDAIDDEQRRRLDRFIRKHGDLNDDLWDELIAERDKLRERVAELEAVRVPVMPRPSTGHPAATHRCGICGGVVQFDGTPPNPECWPAGKKRKEPA